MEIYTSTLDGSTWVDISFLSCYGIFVLLNILTILKFANRKELLQTFIMLTSLLALLSKTTLSSNIFSSHNNFVIGAFQKWIRFKASWVLLFQFRDPISHIQPSSFSHSSLMVNFSFFYFIGYKLISFLRSSTSLWTLKLK